MEEKLESFLDKADEIMGKLRKAYDEMCRLKKERMEIVDILGLDDVNNLVAAVVTVVKDRDVFRSEYLQLRSSSLGHRERVVERLRSFEPNEGEEIDLVTIQRAIEALEIMWESDDEAEPSGS